jgi:anti-sigma-K factor RskA
VRYDNPQLRDQLAGEYVLGALRGRARRRFERLLAADVALHKHVRVWEERLTPLTAETPAVAPPPRVLAALQARLTPADRTRTLSWWQRLGFWRGASAVAASLAVVLGALLVVTQLRPPVPAGPSYVAVLADDTARPALVVTAYNKPSWRLEVEPLAVAAGQTLQVWAVERDTGAVQPLAAVSTDRAQRIALSEAGWKLVKGSESLIVTAEAVAGAREPTGPVLYRGLCINLKGPARS